MARVNIEERLLAEGRLHRLARELKTTTHTAIGLLVYLWHDSQELERNTATREEIECWCRWYEFEIEHYFKSTGEMEIDLISALQKSGYIQAAGENGWKINGNQNQINKLSDWKEKSKKGGLSRVSTAARGDDGKFISSNQPPANQPTSSRSTSAIQFNTIQYKYKKKNIYKKKKSPRLVGSLNLQALWNSNCGTLPKVKSLTQKRSVAWKQRWKEKPDENYWKEIITTMASNEFCCGGGNRGWKATVDYLLRPDTHVKISEGLFTEKNSDDYWKQVWGENGKEKISGTS